MIRNAAMEVEDESGVRRLLREYSGLWLVPGVLTEP